MVQQFYLSNLVGSQLSYTQCKEGLCQCLCPNIVDTATLRLSFSMFVEFPNDAQMAKSKAGLTVTRGEAKSLLKHALRAASCDPMALSFLLHQNK